MTIKDVVAMFENAESDALAVVDGPEARHVIGLLTEAHAPRRYGEERDRRRRELSGEQGGSTAWSSFSAIEVV